MRLVIQRVTHGSVTVNGQIIGQIDLGFVVLVGITHQDSAAHADWLAQKVAGLRVFEDDAGKMNRSLLEVGGGVLAISQFTLYGDARKGRRPSFVDAAPPALAQPVFDRFVESLQQEGIARVETGRFGAMMQVSILNDGPVTIILER